MLIQSSRKSVAVVKEVLNKKPIDTANNSIGFLNGLNEDDLKTTNIKDRISVITWARKIVSKHQQLDIVQAKIDIMKHQVKLFIDLFKTLFDKGLLFF